MSRKDISPSSLGRRWLCPGSYQQELGMPEVQSDWADTGRDMHKIWEKLQDGIELSSEHVHAVGLKNEGDILKALEWSFDLLTRDKPTKAHETKVEYKVDLRFIGCHELCEGTLDLLVFEPFGVGYLKDWKFGNPMTPHDVLEYQLKCYAVGALKEFGLTKVKAACIFPMSQKVVSFEYEAEQIETYCKQIREVEGRCFAKDAPLVPGKYQCSRCKALGSCPAVSGTLDKIVATSHSARDNVERWPDLLALASTASGLSKQVEERAINIIRSGKKLKGWKLEGGLERMEWNPDIHLSDLIAEFKMNVATGHIKEEWCFTDKKNLRQPSVIYNHLMVHDCIRLAEIMKCYTQQGGGNEKLVREYDKMTWSVEVLPSGFGRYTKPIGRPNARRNAVPTDATEPYPRDPSPGSGSQT